MNLRIGTVSKLTGFSPSGIRFLEERGVITPSGGRDGTYRAYSIEDVARLLECKNYRECGFDLLETAQLLTDADADATCQMLNTRAEAIRRRIAELEALEAHIIERTQGIEEAHEDCKPRIVHRTDAMYWAPLWMPDEVVDVPPQIPSEEDGFAIPFADSSILIEGGITTAPSDLNVRIGYAIRSRNAARVPKALGTILIPSTTAVRAIIQVNETFGFDEDDLATIRLYMDDHGLEALGDAFTLRLCTLHDPSEQRFDVMWQPVCI